MSATTRAASEADVATTSAQYTESMQRLMNAQDQLRLAIQAMAQQQVGERRNEAIRQAQQALFDANQAMTQLPPEMRSQLGAQIARSNAAPAASSGVGTTAAAGAGGAVTSPSSAHARASAPSAPYPQSEAEYARAMDKLQQSALKLREAIQAMVQAPQGARRNDAIMQAHQALFDTQTAMIQLPPEKRQAK